MPACEYFNGIDKVDSVLGDDNIALVFIPLELAFMHHDPLTSFEVLGGTSYASKVQLH